MIRRAMSQDAPDIAEIYNWYIENTFITFENVAVTGQDMLARMEQADELHPWFVTEIEGVVSGFAFATGFKPRSAYANTVETTIYLHKDKLGRGIGKPLYEHLIAHLRETTIHVLVSSIALPNPQSIGLHEKLGYTKSGHLSEVGCKFGDWVDVGYWQLVFESK